MALSDALGKPNPLVYLSDSEALLTNIDKWIGEGATPSMEAHQDEDIMRAIIDLLHARVASGFSTIFIKVKAHRGEPCNEMADRAADAGRGAEPIWSWPSNFPLLNPERITSVEPGGVQPEMGKPAEAL